MSGRFLGPLEFRVLGPKRLQLTKALDYVDGLGRRFRVPLDFICDLASVPKVFRSFSMRWEQTAKAGFLHDMLYRWAEVFELSRRESDALYYEALLAGNACPRWRAYLQWLAVRVGAGLAWKNWRETPNKDRGVMPGPVLGV